MSNNHTQKPHKSSTNEQVLDHEQTLLLKAFKKEWITISCDIDMIAFAEEIGKYTAKNDLTTSKIRNIYGEVKRIQMSSFEECKASFYLLKPKMAYTLGRDKNNAGLKVFKNVFDLAFSHVTNERAFDNFCNLFESILAYHKSYSND